MKYCYLLLSIFFLLNFPNSINAKNPPKIKTHISVKDNFLYHGISDIVTTEMSDFTRKYNIGFRNNGCNVIDRTAVKKHNQTIAKSLTEYLGNAKWIEKLPIKIMEVNSHSSFI